LGLTKIIDQLNKIKPGHFIAAGMLLLALMFLLPVHSVGQGSSTTNDKGERWYLWTTHRDENDGLHMAVSRGGKLWTMVNNDKSVFTPENYILRDPCIARDKQGLYHLVWTTGWTVEKIKAVGYSTSRDLVHWEKERYIPVMENEPATVNVWAPEIFFDEKNGDWILTWSSTVLGKFQSTAHMFGERANGRVYYRRTRDFEHFTPTALLFDLGVIAIDQTLLKEDDSTYYIFFKADRDTTGKITNQTHESGIMYARGPSPVGPFEMTGGVISSKGMTESRYMEGPTATSRDGEVWMFYGSFANPGYCGIYASSDMKRWKEISGTMVLPPHYMHGTVIEISEEEGLRLSHQIQ
jgi:hypothetical protein